jgi:hypothetical protein
MIALGYIAILWFFGDALVRRWFRFVSVPHRIATGFLVGLLTGTWITYLTALVASGTSDPMAIGVLTSSFGMIVAGIWLWQNPPLVIVTPWQRLRSDPVEWFLVLLVAVGVGAMMIWTYHFDQGTLWIAGDLWSDFGPTSAISQSFALGQNFPTEYPHFAGEPIRYHFLYYFAVGNATYLGLDPATANNLLSIGSVVALLVVVAAVGERLFGTRLVGWIAVVLFFLHGSLSFIPYLGSFPSLDAIAALPNLDHFCCPGSPTGSEEWGIWTQDAYLNQRHLPSAIGILLVIVLFVLDRLRTGIRTASRGSAGMAGGYRLGRRRRSVACDDRSSPDRHGSRDPSRPVGARLRPVRAAGGPTAALERGDVHRGRGGPGHPVRRLPESAADDRAGDRGGDPGDPGTALPAAGHDGRRPDVPDRVLGLHGRRSPRRSGGDLPRVHLRAQADPVGGGLIAGSWRQARVFLAFVALVAVAFENQFSLEVFANHKFIHGWLIVANLFAANGLVLLWRIRGSFHWPARVVAAGLVVVIVTGGIVDLIPIRTSGCTRWRLTATRSTVGDGLDRPRGRLPLVTFVVHGILEAGRRICLGWPYYAWSAGYDVEPAKTGAADLRAAARAGGTAPGRRDRLRGDRRRPARTRARRPDQRGRVRANLQLVFDDQENRYGHLAVYRVPPDPSAIAGLPMPHQRTCTPAASGRARPVRRTSRARVRPDGRWCASPTRAATGSSGSPRAAISSGTVDGAADGSNCIQRADRGWSPRPVRWSWRPGRGSSFSNARGLFDRDLAAPDVASPA